MDRLPGFEASVAPRNIGITSFHPDKGDAKIPVTEHLFAYESFRVYATFEEKELGINADVDMDFVWGNGSPPGYILKSLTVASTDDVPITGTTLRAIPIAELQQFVLVRAVEQHVCTADNLTWRDVSTTIRKWVSDGHKLKPSPENLDLLAMVYEFSTVLALSPVKTIRELFNLAPSTATHWVKLARERGHLAIPATNLGNSPHA